MPKSMAALSKCYFISYILKGQAESARKLSVPLEMAGRVGTLAEEERRGMQRGGVWGLHFYTEENIFRQYYYILNLQD